MKVRVTLMTENDKHVFDESVSDEKIQKLTELGWGLVADMFSNDDEICIVEKVEVVER